MESRLQPIPVDIVSQILSRLPIKSLHRFKSVCKTWFSLLSDPKFCLSSERDGVVVWSWSKFTQRSFSLHSMDDNASVKELRTPWKEKSSSISIWGSCNGFLLVLSGRDLFLWNPSTGYYRKMLAYHHFLISMPYRITTGLCYDSSTDDYKAVIGIAYPGGRAVDDGGIFVLVGSFKINVLRRIHFPYNTRSVHRGPVVNGQLHWSISKSDTNFSASNLIIYFDPLKDEFKELPIPHRGENLIFGLGVLGGCLCMVRWDNENNYIEVLAMREYGVKESWTTMFFISNLKLYPPWERLEPLCFTRDGEILMLIVHAFSNKILAYNPKEGSHRIFATSLIDYRRADVATYVESLVSPKPKIPLEYIVDGFVKIFRGLQMVGTRMKMKLL
ncbi:hypothetical protein F0562_000163 [Nyssa sinensis]|uniref:F-box domain-containing protein n=1 Tax=Nyssa sinensis TaxID=561372 RepID=A0A5J5C370_9ASTE|nr:hypothetical protein F0562_000163 [Nyssa sinensis]